MKAARQNKFVRALLRAIDICVAFYLGRRVHWEKPPFRPATETQWRTGRFFVACFPIFTLVFTGNNFVHSFVERTGDPGHPIIWLYVAYVGFISFGVFGLLKIGPKVPLYLSIPTAMAAWIYCIWLLGFHSEKVFSRVTP